MCLTELSVEESGVIWMRENENTVVVVHAKRCGVVMRGDAMNKCIAEGQQKCSARRLY